jgi:hypothetical protein
MVVTERSPRVDQGGHPHGSRVAGRLLCALIAGVAVWALTLFLTNHPSRTPVYAAIPTQPPRVSVLNGVCHSTDGLGPQRAGTGQVWVDSDPSGAVVVWLPGAAYPPCRPSVITRLDTAHARALAAAVRSAKPPSAGISACPSDNGISVTVLFTYPGKAKAEVVRWFPSGCPAVTAPGRDERVLPESGYEALRPAPSPWSNYTGG